MPDAGIWYPGIFFIIAGNVHFVTNIYPLISIIAFLVEVIGWLKIMASPLFIGLLIGGVIYYKWRNDAGLAVAALVAGIGLFAGIIWATTIWHKHGTMNYLSKLNVTLDLDKLTNDSKK